MATTSDEAQIGQRRSYDGALCTVRYVGEVAGTAGSWLGVEWDDASRGKHDGQHKGVRYFSCKSKSPTAASFIRPSRPVDAPQTFVSALQLKYVGDPAADQDRPEPHKQIVISGKVAQEIGFDKIRRKQAQLAELKIIILDGSRVAFASHPSSEQQSISQVCPKVTELDLSRNLFNRFSIVVEICSELGGLNALRVRGNRFQDVLHDKGLDAADLVFKGIKELAIDETLLEWPEICHLASKFGSLNALFSSANQLSVLSPIPPAPFTSTLVSAHLEFNEFTSIADLAPLATITSLRNLHLKANLISTIVPSSSTKPPVFTSNLHYLDISYNQVSSWSLVDSLAESFPGLTSLRFAHNPIYDNPDLDNHDQAAAPSSGNKAATNTDESYMLMLARLPTLKILNFSAITLADRANAEMFYLSRIARQLAAVPEAEEAGVLARHRRWAELCDIYGEPSVVRQHEVDANFLEARLIGVQFYTAQSFGGQMMVMATRATKIPKSFDIYTVKGIAGKLFGLPPLRIKLVWETGEWDPVAGFDEEAGDSSGEEELEAELERKGGEGGFGDEASQVERRGGRWVKRETELKDGPRQFGYCVDGPEVKIRLEMQ
ncbi:hypothetical protein B0H67DRAFT_67329 [Lasiosphaeris hirsuta]|uniref:CAP-Gly domain-containing protein n=1 Tax=Lasiosphaeris hirsuta TaxID=260670 RepID=A0AA40BC77_9PEZI|nr:hypothetical protein B0H67DRAFT_67329 [Lasiosphaeris hirsuta]